MLDSVPHFLDADWCLRSDGNHVCLPRPRTFPLHAPPHLRTDGMTWPIPGVQPRAAARRTTVWCARSSTRSTSASTRASAPSPARCSAARSSWFLMPRRGSGMGYQACMGVPSMRGTKNFTAGPMALSAELALEQALPTFARRYERLGLSKGPDPQTATTPHPRNHRRGLVCSRLSPNPSSCRPA